TSFKCDWSSDVCSSDLAARDRPLTCGVHCFAVKRRGYTLRSRFVPELKKTNVVSEANATLPSLDDARHRSVPGGEVRCGAGRSEIGRASGRDRGGLGRD